MASSSSSSLLFLLLLPLVAAQTYHWGTCPTPMLQPNFTLQQYVGHWYEIQKLPASFEKGKCIEADYSVRPDGTIQVLNKLLYKGKVTTAEGTAVVIDPREPARLGISFSYCERSSSSSSSLLWAFCFLHPLLVVLRQLGRLALFHV